MLYCTEQNFYLLLGECLTWSVTLQNNVGYVGLKKKLFCGMSDRRT